MRRRSLVLVGVALGLGACVEGEVDRGPAPESCSGGKCDDADADDVLAPEEMFTCPDRDGEREIREHVSTLLADVAEGRRPEIDTLDEFVAALPESTRSNLLFLTESRALARVHDVDTRKRLLLDTRASDERTITTQDGKWCLEQGEGSHACVEARVLLMSPQGDFIGSFTTSPTSPSKDRFEMTMFDPVTSRVDMFEVDFTEATPKVDKNPRSCMGCHQGDDGSINFRLDPYRFWSYVVPFDEDNLRPGSVEAEWYLSLLRRVESGAEPALARLDPMNDAQEIADALEGGRSYQLDAPDADVDFATVDSPGLNLSHQLLEKNACRTARTLAERPDWDRIKYAALGGLIDCENVEDFWPTEGRFTREDAERFFADRQEGLGDDGFDLDTFVAQTHAKQTRLLSDKISRRFDHLAEYVGEERAWEEVDAAMKQAAYSGMAGYGISNFETYGPHIAKARYLLEPLGVDVAQWSMSVDRTHHSHVEFLYPIPQQPVFIDLLKREFDIETKTGRSFDAHECQDLSTRSDGNGSPQSRSGSCRAALQTVRPQLCSELAEASRTALLDHEVDIATNYAASPRRGFAEYFDFATDSPAALDAQARQIVQNDTAEEIRERAAAVYDMNCAGCHINGYFRGRPFYPFRDMDNLETMFARADNLLKDQLDGDRIGRNTAAGQYDFEYISHADRIWDRITRHPLTHGAMPATGEPLSRDEKLAIRAHMLSVGAAD
jgi:hypothetical protein